MAQHLVTVEQAAKELSLHPKTVLRYIRDKRLPATRVGRAYRILRSELDAFAGIANGRAARETGAQTTAITEVETIGAEAAERLATFLQSAALTGDSDTPPLRVQTAFDPTGQTLKIVAIGIPSDVGRLLEMLQLHLSARS